MGSQLKTFGFPEVRGPGAERRKHLNFIDSVRNDGLAVNREFMGPMVSIPPLDWSVLKLRFPELIAPDAQIQKQAWDTFMAHPASLPYRTKEKRRTNGTS